MGPSDPSQSLEKLLNIGPKLAEALRAVGISTGRELNEIGSLEAALRIAQQRPTDSPCRSMLCALEGAVRSVRWNAIAKSDRDRLWREFEAARAERL